MKRWLRAVGRWLDAPAGVPREHPADADAPDPAGSGRADGLVVCLRQRLDDAARHPGRSPASAWRSCTCRRPTRRTRACCI